MCEEQIENKESQKKEIEKVNPEKKPEPIKGGPFFHDFVYPQNGFFSLILERFLALYQGYDEKSYMPP